MEYYNNTLCISHAELLQIKSNAAIKAMCHRRRERNIQVRKGGGAGNNALYAVNKHPSDLKMEFYKRFPNMQGKAERKQLMKSMGQNAVEVGYWAMYKWKKGRNWPPEKKRKYTNNGAI